MTVFGFQLLVFISCSLEMLALNHSRKSGSSKRNSYEMLACFLPKTENRKLKTPLRLHPVAQRFSQGLLVGVLDLAAHGQALLDWHAWPRYFR